MQRDAIGTLEHDHQSFAKSVRELHQRLSAAGQDGSLPEARYESVAPLMMHLLDDLFAHFAREEEALFPFVVQHFPEREGQVARMLAAHDRICGAGARILALGRAGTVTEEQWALVTSLFWRFEADYEAHSLDESEMLSGLAAQLPAPEREALNALLRSV